MSVLLLTHPSAAAHRVPRAHPERPERIEAVVAGVRTGGVGVVEEAPPEATRELLHLVHEPGYVSMIEEFCARGGGALDPDTYASSGSWEAALRAAGAGPAAARRIDAGAVSVAFSAMRPPGHHAERDRAMGFCLFNNVAVTAAWLAERDERVAIVDWDVHHGNGTQHAFWEDDRVLYVSLHRFPFYPGSGGLDEVGAGRGRGYTINVPLPAGSDATTYRAAFREVVVPALDGFAPDRVVVSAGYDAHRRDPLGGMALDDDDYRWMAAAVAAVAGSGGVVVQLEGGYDLQALRNSAATTVRGLETGGVDLDGPSPGGEAGRRVVAAAATVAAAPFGQGRRL